MTTRPRIYRQKGDGRAHGKDAAGGRGCPLHGRQALHLHLGLGKPGLHRLPPADLVPARAQDADRLRRGHRVPRRRLRAVRHRGGRRDRGHPVRRLDGGPARAADAVCAQEAEGLRPQRADRGPPGARPARPAGRGPHHRRPQQGQLLQCAARGGRHRRAHLRGVLLRHLSRERRRSSATSASSCITCAPGGTCWSSPRPAASSIRSSSTRSRNSCTTRPAGRRPMAASPKRRSRVWNSTIRSRCRCRRRKPGRC